jgi:ABC-type multidrug transport system fused ATPase/permease subunit
VSRRGDAAERAERDAVALARDRLRPEAFDVVRCAGAEAVEHRRFAGLLARAEAAVRAHGVARGCLMGSLDAVGKLTVLGVVFRGGARVERGDMTGGDLLAFALYAAYAALGLAGLARVALGDRKAFRRAEERLLAALDAAGADGAAAAAEAAEAAAPDPEEAAVALDGVDVAYAGRGDLALRGVSLRAAAGRVTGIVGASGAGKSTLLRCCAGLVAPAAGAVRVCGVDVHGGDAARVAAVRRTLASHVQQGAPLLAHGPRLLDAVAYLGLGAPVDVERARGAVAACAGPVSESVGGLEGGVGRDAGDLSGGQKNRVALARALYRAGARVLLLDEPTAALDGPGEAAALDGALGAARRRGCAVLLVAHSRAAISRCDDVVVLERGRVVERGAYGALAADPSSRLNALLE